MPSTFVYPTYTIGAWAANVDDDYSCRWGVSPGTNVTDGVGVKLHTNSRPFGAGSYRSTQYDDSRTITLQGWVQCPNRVGMVAARTRFLSIFPTGDQQLLVIDDGIAAKQILVEASDAQRVSVWQDGCGFDWQLTLYAADPRYLDPTVQSASASVGGASTDGLDWNAGSPGGLDWAAGSPGGLDWGTSGAGGVLALANTGNAEAWPVFTITAAVLAPTLTTPIDGRSISYSGLVDTGQTLTIDTSPYSRSVRLDGIDRFALLTSAQWFPIPPGGTLTVQFSGTGAGLCTATWQYANN